MGASQARDEQLMPEIANAAYNKDWNKVFELLKQSPQLLDKVEKMGQHLLHFAADEGNLNAIEKLIELGAFVDILDRMDHTPIGFAAAKGQLDIIKALFAQNADINILDASGHGPLYACAVRGHLDCVKFLVEHGADTTAQDVYNGKTPLEMAIQFKRNEVATYLQAHKDKLAGPK
mmetsp:Transcript_10474/g.11522  ORF Transcript_10474/g.11522 Transcript_10474/m.11522 type:complete len:176 (+) Transcript_10474:34-561(+)